MRIDVLISKVSMSLESHASSVSVISSDGDLATFVNVSALEASCSCGLGARPMLKTLRIGAPRYERKALVHG